MTLGVGECPAPGVKTVTSDQHRLGRRIFVEERAEPRRQTRHVLIVLENRDQLAMLVSGNAVEALQHLEFFDRQLTVRRVQIGEQGGPNGMRVEHRSRAAPADDRQVQLGLGRRSQRGLSDDATGFVETQNLRGRQRALVDGAGRDRELELRAMKDRAEIPARPHDPTAVVKAASDP